MKKQNFQEFLDYMSDFQESRAEAGLYIATNFGLKKYEILFTNYLQMEENEQEVDDEEVYKKYIKMLNHIKWRYPFRYWKMNKYIEQNL